MTTKIQAHKTESPSYFYRNICIAVAVLGVAAISVGAIYFQGMKGALSRWDFWMINGGTTLTVTGAIGIFQSNIQRSSPAAAPPVPVEEKPTIVEKPLIEWRDLIQRRFKNGKVCQFARTLEEASKKIEEQTQYATQISQGDGEFFIPETISTNLHKKVSKPEYGIASHHNYKRHMEDWGFVQEFNIQNTMYRLSVVVDGHDDRLEMGKLMESQLLRLIIDIIGDGEWNDKTISDAFTQAYEAIHIHYLEEYDRDGGGCVLAVLSDPHRIICSNAGDCRALEIHFEEENTCTVTQLTADASVEDPSAFGKYNEYFCKDYTNEKTNLCHLKNNKVTYNGRRQNNCGLRISGLNMAISVGDRALKCEPQITKHVTKKNSYLVLVSDGVTNAFSNKAIGNGLLQMHQKNMNPAAMAMLLIEAAMQRYMDNVIAIVIKIS